MSEKPAHHRVDVIRIKQVLPHGNADKLEIVPIEGFQAVVGKGQFKIGDLAYYIPPDSVVPDRPEFTFLWGNATFEGGTPIKKRRVTAKKLRGEWSEGLLMPVGLKHVDGPNAGYFACEHDYVPCNFVSGPTVHDETTIMEVQEGDDVSEFLGITHYNPPESGDPQMLPQGGSGKKGLPRSFRGWYHLIKGWLNGERREFQGPDNTPTYDVDNLKKYMNAFQPGELVQVTEKIHGSNARYTYRQNPSLLFSILGKPQGKMFAGSRNLWKAENSKCAWRKALVDNPWIEAWCRTNPGCTLYGEIVPTQKGKGFEFTYGAQAGKVRFFLFDIRLPDGRWAEIDEVYKSTTLLSSHVPILYQGAFDLDLIKARFVDGPSTVFGTKHIREGVVIKAVPERNDRGVGRVQLKLVSNAFLEKDSQWEPEELNQKAA